MSKLPFKTAYDASVQQSVDFTDVQSKTAQEFKNDCDINALLKRLTIDDVTRFQTRTERNPMFNDNFGKYDDYQQLLNKVLEADDIFCRLSSEDREKFNNDPSEYFSFLQNKSEENSSKNSEESVQPEVDLEKKST